MAEAYDGSQASGLEAKADAATDKLASDQKAAQDKGKAATQNLAASRKAAAEKSAGGAATSTAPPSVGGMGAVKNALSGNGGLVGAAKSKISSLKPSAGAPSPVAGAAPAADAMQAAPMVHGGKDLIPTGSPKGQALTQDPKDNLAAKGRFSDYRKVFTARGAAGKHSWGGK